MVDPGDSYENVLAGQLSALTLNVGFDAYDAGFGSNDILLGDLFIGSGPFEGWTVNAFLAEANLVIGGCSNAYTPEQINEAASAINENYDNGTSDNGFLYCVICNIEVSCSRVNGTCSNNNLGSASVSVTGGTAPLSYAWSNGGTGSSISGLLAGVYSVTVTDANGCDAECSVSVSTVGCCNVTSGGTINGSLSNCGPVCNVVLGNTQLPSGGLGTIEYIWLYNYQPNYPNYGNNGWVPIPNSNSPTYSPGCVNVTTYYIRCARRSGCSSYPGESNMVSVIINPVPVAQCSKTDVLCFGENTGTASVLVSSGTAPFSYSWSNGAAGSSASGLSAGDYSVTVTDANGCTASCSVNVGQPSLLEVSSSAGSIACYGGTTTVTVSASGGTPPYSGTGDYEVGAGDYSYTVTDANGCSATTSGSVSEPSQLVASSSAGSIACYGGTTTVTVSASGGTAPYSGTGEFTVSAGDYSYTVTDANGCSSTTSVSVSEPSLLVAASSSAGAILCNGGTTTVNVSASGGTAPYSGTGSFTVGAGDYSYTVTDANGCEATTSISVDEPSLLVASSSAGTILCHGGSTSVSVSASGGTPPYSGTGSFTVGAGTYSYTVTDANGCSASTSVTVTEPAAMTLIILGTNIFPSGSGSVSVSASGGSAPYSYLWSPGGATTSSITNLSPGTYCVVVTDANGCSASRCYEVTMCLGAGGGKTLGFWSNNNGQALVNAAMITQLNILSLRNANGSDFDMLGTMTQNKKALKNWLLAASATNMSYMLSAQLAAMKMNVMAGFVNGSAFIYAPGTNSANSLGLASVNAVMNEANAILLTNGVILSGNPLRARAEAVKIALDKGNNNLNFLIQCVTNKEEVLNNPDQPDAVLPAETELSVYPNPTGGMLTVKYPVEDLLSKTYLHIYDLTGREVYSMELNNSVSSVKLDIQQDLQHYGTGIYFVRVINGNFVYNKKLSFINQ